MSVPVGTLVDTVLLRVRDVQGTATSREQARLLITHVQRLVQASAARQLSYVGFTLEARRTVYSVRGVDDRAVYVVGIRVAGESVRMAEWRSLAQTNRSWFRSTGAQPRVWARLGLGLFAVSPAPREPLDAQLVCVRLPADLIEDETATDVPDEYAPTILDLTEGLISLRVRLNASGAPALARAFARLGVDTTRDSLEGTSAAS